MRRWVDEAIIRESSIAAEDVVVAGGSGVGGGADCVFSDGVGFLLV